MNQTLTGKNILLIISGGIAAYKSLDLIRRLKERGAGVRCVLTGGGAQFVTPLSVAALSEEAVFQDLFSLKDESEMGHIRLSREADLLVVAPASADLMAKMAAGLANDLASTVLLATDKPVLFAPAMNTVMWDHPATKRNYRILLDDGLHAVGPGQGDLACGEVGAGRMSEPLEIVAAAENIIAGQPTGQPVAAPLKGRRAIVTSGPTYEAIDPVRYLANRSSGKQGHAIAAALAGLGAEVVLVAGPNNQPDPSRVTIRNIESAAQMLAACEAALPADIAVCAAAVADWRVAGEAEQKMKKDGSGRPPALNLVENPDILATLSQMNGGRPSLVVGFAAETEKVVDHAQSKRTRKGCDWIVANDVGTGTRVMGGDENTVHLITAADVENWPKMPKDAVATTLAKRIADHFINHFGSE
ncbi:MAG: bifunctional phosphopantothenoylcysteine decarboxylase/phosphopantothenate--cysteine ligase CoaBC [Alphaproteobacteria bacterium]|jgi:phosphopantothenoylcysteine decarboxylase/phosphopantothenate--cysteine ligase|nr:bifunctional phosphopantothenoylcysteine decarboxylase/phosphopantothenate--cysteine ligase CoaBC [Rhodospirillaceae bacterium]MDP6024058.1 bifunctional phosphopantothenoylcysteine decarboxylase/phosphopantothenate--cysteine ligase CoaBC [Alphaproteobacteria bacterium]MDP6256286.1 bifunctional phosphopantothenoylcysteine decarboxylase/phosphopantothenate--cysteine ligase CoaBC [Alphaproteobacteria bacterium]MDP7054958.1 bifunctional phosphopantothenoylcysteine decarboxylase/phosphopantothenat|tara:strand:+ start:6071 stop:7318 length:1248 start_codon:yes stop_codon:yes gene_type:complete